MAKLIIIAAIGSKNELGYNNQLIWHLKEDLDNFKKLTNNHYILMGKNTYNSLPKKLPNRKYIILSKTMISNNDYIVYNNIDEFLNFFSKQNEDIYIIGGASIYNKFINIANEMILTEIEDSFPKADVFFPKYNKTKWKKRIISTHKEKNINYKIVKYYK